MRVTVTSAAADRRMSTPANLIALVPALDTAGARRYLDAASAIAEGQQGLRFPPWRQSYVLGLAGTDDVELGLYAKPVESATITDFQLGIVDASDFRLTSNGSAFLDRAERDAGWLRRFTGTAGVSRTPVPESETDAWIATTTAGWIMPGQVGPWGATTAYKVEIATTSSDDPSTGNPYLRGSWVRPTDPRVVLRFECTTAGTTGAAEPTEFIDSATVAGTTITDGSATWTARSAFELPDDLSEAALRLALSLQETEDTTRVITEEDADGVETKYDVSGELDGALPARIAATLRAYR